MPLVRVSNGGSEVVTGYLQGYDTILGFQPRSVTIAFAGSVPWGGSVNFICFYSADKDASKFEWIIVSPSGGTKNTAYVNLGTEVDALGPKITFNLLSNGFRCTLPWYDRIQIFYIAIS